jgi:hypothetical protein
MTSYFLAQDRQIGHELVVERDGFKRKLGSKPVYYNQFINRICSEADKPLYLESIEDRIKSPLLEERTDRLVSAMQGIAARDVADASSIGRFLGYFPMSAVCAYLLPCKPTVNERIESLGKKFMLAYHEKALKIFRGLTTDNLMRRYRSA